MDDASVQRQIAQMSSFIRQEAREKAHEIRVAADEEFTIEKLQLVEAAKQSIRKEFERKEGQFDVRKKIEEASELSSMRMRVLHVREKEMQSIRDEAWKRLSAVTANAAQYKQLLQNLILEGALKLEEPALIVRGREADARVVKEAIPEAARLVQQVTGRKVTIELSTKFLPGSSAGGVVVAAVDGKVTCSQTFEDRLAICYHHMVPNIRELLFAQ
mmetsp:Transcript_24990/g.81895  ORF Transcript_24990/g.81895 Transcript_24990/m.81895 type:complete len:216 (+) Transcript_24990:49-696(+)